MKNILIFIFFIVPTWLYSQEPDSILTKKIIDLEVKIDSLQKTILAMDNQIEELKQNTIEGKTKIEEVLAVFGEGDVESANLESRSRYKRIDDLLNSIKQRPGQLVFNGNVTSITQLSFYNNSRDSYGTGSFSLCLEPSGQE